MRLLLNGRNSPELSIWLLEMFPLCSRWFVAFRSNPVHGPVGKSNRACWGWAAATRAAWGDTSLTGRATVPPPQPSLCFCVYVSSPPLFPTPKTFSFNMQQNCSLQENTLKWFSYREMKKTPRCNPSLEFSSLVSSTAAADRVSLGYNSLFHLGLLVLFFRFFFCDPIKDKGRSFHTCKVCKRRWRLWKKREFRASIQSERLPCKWINSLSVKFLEILQD